MSDVQPNDFIEMEVPKQPEQVEKKLENTITAAVEKSGDKEQQPTKPEADEAKKGGADTVSGAEEKAADKHKHAVLKGIEGGADSPRKPKVGARLRVGLNDPSGDSSDSSDDNDEIKQQRGAGRARFPPKRFFGDGKSSTIFLGQFVEKISYMYAAMVLKGFQNKFKLPVTSVALHTLLRLLFTRNLAKSFFQYFVYNHWPNFRNFIQTTIVILAL